MAQGLKLHKQPSTSTVRFSRLDYFKLTVGRKYEHWLQGGAVEVVEGQDNDHLSLLSSPPEKPRNLFGRSAGPARTSRANIESTWSCQASTSLSSDLEQDE